MDDQKILALYFSRDEQAVLETARKYGSYCYSIADNILHSAQDAEETVNDTYLQTWNAIPPKHPDVFKLFLARITRNLAFSRWRKECAGKRGGGEMDLVLEELSECLASPGAVDDGLSVKELEMTIRAFLSELPQKERNLFLRRYFYVEDCEKIAARYGMKRGTVSSTLFRTREKLRNHLKKEGYAL